MTKILFVGVFDAFRKSTNTSQIFCFKRLGLDVVGYNYRQKEAQIGRAARDNNLTEIIQNGAFDFVLFSKCNGVGIGCFEAARNHSTALLWWMDPLNTLQAMPEMFDKARTAHGVFTGVKNTIDIFREYNKNVYYIAEGFDEEVDKPHKLPKDEEVVFIGSLHGERKALLEELAYPVKHVTNAFGADHAKMVSRSKICLNFATAGATSDRVYKTLAAKGFILSSDWASREEDFLDGEELVIFKDIPDLREKIKFYLNHPQKRDIISAAGCKKVQRFNRTAWAAQIIQIYKEDFS